MARQDGIVALKPAELQWSEDGTPVSARYGDVYFQRGHALAESDYVFLRGNNLHTRFASARGDFAIAELGFGTGLNMLQTARLWRDTAAKRTDAAAHLSLLSIEKYPLTREDLERALALWPEFSDFSSALLRHYPPAMEGFFTIPLARDVTLTLCLGDVADVLPRIAGKFDAWFLDGFAPASNPEMWMEEFYPAIAARTKKGGTAASFSAVGYLRRGLAAAGFTVEKQKGFRFKFAMTVAAFPGEEKTQESPRRAVVLGAGIAGAAAAYALARRGLAVTVLERRSGAAQGASGNPVAVVYPKLTVGHSALGDYHRHGFFHARAVYRETGLETWNPCGVRHVPTAEEDTLRTQKIRAADVDAAEIFTPDDDGGYMQALAGTIDPAATCRTLLAHENIALHVDTKAEKIIRHENAWRVETGEKYFDADIVVMAAGYDIAELAPKETLPTLETLRGQVSVIAASPASKNLQHVICHDGYITPAQDGKHCIGATFTREPPEDHPPLRGSEDAENIAALEKNLPALGLGGAKTLSSRASFRTAAPDRLPLIGACPGDGMDGVYISAAFGAHGMTGAPLAGEMIAALATGAPLPVPDALAQALDPARFIRRAARKNKNR